MTNHKPNSTSSFHHPVTPAVMAASIAVSISGACLVPFNPALARTTDSMPLVASVTPGPIAHGDSLRSLDSLLLASSLATSDMQVQNIVSASSFSLFEWIFRFFTPTDPCRLYCRPGG